MWSEEAAAPPVEREHARRTFGSRVITARRRVAAGRTRMTSRAPFATISLAGFGAPGEQPQWAMTSQHAHATHVRTYVSRLIIGMFDKGHTSLWLYPGRGTTQNTPEKTAAGSAADVPGKTVSRRPVPHFMVASAAGDTQLPAAGVPAWRGVLANLLAGAMAGCAVEAGEAPCCTLHQCAFNLVRRCAATRRFGQQVVSCPRSAVPNRHDQDAHADGADRRRRACTLQVRRRQGAVRR